MKILESNNFLIGKIRLHKIYNEFTKKWFEILHRNHTITTTGLEIGKISKLVIDEKSIFSCYLRKNKKGKKVRK